jgi:hypothetical protein
VLTFLYGGCEIIDRSPADPEREESKVRLETWVLHPPGPDGEEKDWISVLPPRARRSLCILFSA